VRRSLETVERISHPPEGIQISGNINWFILFHF
jgi:hypothetical protein